VKRKKDIKKLVKNQYAKIAREGGSCCSTCDRPFDPIERAKSIGYSDQEIGSVPETALMGLGCGNPTALAELKEGETVLDLGCGGGLDAFLAARKVGEKGKVIGVDMTTEMVEKARNNARKGDYKNVEFKLAEIENLPIDDNCIDVVISNCVINHCPDKLAVFREVFRVLKPNGRMLISDLVVEGEFSEDILQDKVWGQWIAGALAKQKYLHTIHKAGFRDVVIAGENPFYMSERDDRLKQKIISIQAEAYK
jgi:SAM-dependent methyltransferase